jgi:hypothetical protein
MKMLVVNAVVVVRSATTVVMMRIWPDWWLEREVAVEREDSEEEDEIFTKMSFLSVIKMPKLPLCKMCV